jgi:hypothetical protein
MSVAGIAGARVKGRFDPPFGRQRGASPPAPLLPLRGTRPTGEGGVPALNKNSLEDRKSLRDCCFLQHPYFTLTFTPAARSSSSRSLSMSWGVYQAFGNDELDNAPTHTPSNVSMPPRMKAEFTVSSVRNPATITVTKGKSTN